MIQLRNAILGILIIVGCLAAIPAGAKVVEGVARYGFGWRPSNEIIDADIKKIEREYAVKKAVMEAGFAEDNRKLLERQIRETQESMAREAEQNKQFWAKYKKLDEASQAAERETQAAVERANALRAGH